ncbi:MAG: hypothetical protein KatS3mg117_3119 [Geminicoccaceae bacterium]|nr:MAG: hypothetical protein KatS3mg117_3119 [Geminicoccaceae bacterium]
MLEPTAAPMPTTPPTSAGSRVHDREAGADGFALLLALLGAATVAGPGAGANPEPPDSGPSATTQPVKNVVAGSLGTLVTAGQVPPEMPLSGPSPVRSPGARDAFAAAPLHSSPAASAPSRAGSGPIPADAPLSADPAGPWRFGAPASSSTSAASPIAHAPSSAVPISAPAEAPPIDPDPAATAAIEADRLRHPAPGTPEKPGGEALASATAGREEASLSFSGTSPPRPEPGGPLVRPDRNDADAFAADPLHPIEGTSTANATPKDEPAGRAALVGTASVTIDPPAAPAAIGQVFPSRREGSPAPSGTDTSSAPEEPGAVLDPAAPSDPLAVDAALSVDPAPGAEIGSGRPSGDAAALPRPYAPTPPPASVQIAAALWQRDGVPVERLRIALQPAELGGVEVTLTSEGRRKARALVLVDRPETLELLQREQQTLERIFTASGLELEAGGFELGLRRDGEHRGGRFASSRAEAVGAGPELRPSAPAPARLLELRLLDLVV